MAIGTATHCDAGQGPTIKCGLAHDGCLRSEGQAIFQSLQCAPTLRSGIQGPGLTLHARRGPFGPSCLRRKRKHGLVQPWGPIKNIHMFRPVGAGPLFFAGKTAVLSFLERLDVYSLRFLMVDGPGGCALRANCSTKSGRPKAGRKESNVEPKTHETKGPSSAKNLTAGNDQTFCAASGYNSKH